MLAQRPEDPGPNVRESGDPQGVQVKPDGNETGKGAAQEKTSGEYRRYEYLPARDLKTTNTHAERDSEIRDQPRQMSRAQYDPPIPRCERVLQATGKGGQ